MAAPAAIDANTRPAASEDVVSLHILVSSFFLGAGGLLYALSILALVFPSVFPVAVSFGRVRPAAMSLVMIGWLAISFTGAAYYVLPRLTGATLWNPALARLGMFGLAGMAIVGAGASMAGLGDGGEPLGMPWWLDMALLAVLLVPLAVAVQTVRSRTEPISYVTMWFVLAGVVSLPILQLAQAVPAETSIGRVLQGLNFTAGFTTLWVTGMGVGLAYYTAVKVTDQPLANRQLARAGFWSIVFAASWAGPLQMVFGPTPNWLDAVAAVLTLALPVGAAANAIAIGTTVAPAWSDHGSEPAVRATMAGLAFAVAGGAVTAVAGFRSAASLVGFTAYWEGVVVVMLFGVGGLLVAGWTHQALPVVSGRRSVSNERANQSIRFTAWGVAIAALFMMIGGVTTGIGWAGGAYQGTPATGEGWAIVSGTGSLLTGLSLVGIAILLLGQLGFILSVLSTISSGRAIVQEVLVEKGGAE